MDVILSIKPKYTKKIIKGKKKYEFRRKIFKNQNVRYAIIYSSSPDKKIIGYFLIGDIISKEPKDLWAELKKESGISKKEFFNYFKGSKIGYAIKITDLQLLSQPKEFNEICLSSRPPQSYMYIDNLSI